MIHPFGVVAGIQPATKVNLSPVWLLNPYSSLVQCEVAVPPCSSVLQREVGVPPCSSLGK